MASLPGLSPLVALGLLSYRGASPCCSVHLFCPVVVSSLLLCLLPLSPSSSCSPFRVFVRPGCQRPFLLLVLPCVCLLLPLSLVLPGPLLPVLSRIRFSFVVFAFLGPFSSSLPRSASLRAVVFSSLLLVPLFLLLVGAHSFRWAVRVGDVRILGRWSSGSFFQYFRFARRLGALVGSACAAPLSWFPLVFPMFLGNS